MMSSAEFTPKRASLNLSGGLLDSMGAPDCHQLI